MKVSVMTNGGCKCRVLVKLEEAGRTATHQVGLVLDRVDAAHVAGDFYSSANDHDNKVPRAVLDEGEVRDGEEQQAVDDAANHREGEGWAVHPYGSVVVGHFDDSR